MPYATFEEALKNYIEAPSEEVNAQVEQIAKTLSRKDAVVLSEEFHLSAAEAIAIIEVLSKAETKAEQEAWSLARHRLSELNQAAYAETEDETEEME